jgi:hypothetical protein
MPKVAPEIAAGRVIVAHLGSGASMRTITTRMPGTATQPGANIELVEPLLDILDGPEAIIFDVPGVGGSPPPRVPYRPWHLVRLSARLLD